MATARRKRSCSTAESEGSTCARSRCPSPRYPRSARPRCTGGCSSRGHGPMIPSAVPERESCPRCRTARNSRSPWSCSMRPPSGGRTPPLVVADSDYGTNVAFRNGLTARGIRGLMAVNADTAVLPATGAPVTAWAQRHPAIGVHELARANQYRARRFVYRPKTTDHPARSGWFVAVPVHIAGIIERGHVATTDSRLLPERTLLIQWRRKHDAEAFRSWITDLPADTPLSVLVKHATSRWHIETDYRETEQALGLGDYEGRTYAGFHHHVTLVSAAHLFCLEQHLHPKGAAMA